MIGLQNYKKNFKSKFVLKVLKKIFKLWVMSASNDLRNEGAHNWQKSEKNHTDLVIRCYTDSEKAV